MKNKILFGVNSFFFGRGFGEPFPADRRLVYLCDKFGIGHIVIHFHSCGFLREKGKAIRAFALFATGAALCLVCADYVPLQSL